MQLNAKNGFTLIELSIVLIIISLIVAGITGGQSLIKQAELKAIVTEVQGFETALNTFDLQYDAKPGDFDQATDYWTAGTASGNGDGIITYGGSHEWLLAWEHLSLAGILPGDFDGTTSGVAADIGANVPAAKIKGGGYMILNGAMTDNTNKSVDALHIALGTADGVRVRDSLLEVKDAVSIDKKIDDGLAETGSVTAQDGENIGTGGDCADIAVASDWNFLLSSTGKNCVMFFWQ